MLNLLKSNRGITLVELLASITITAIVIVLISNVLITSFRHQDQSQSHLNLRQEANLIVTELRNVHSGDNQFELCNINNRILLNDRQLSRESVLIEELLINERPLASNSKSECLMVDPKVPLPVHFTLNDKNNNPFKLETVLHRLESNNQISVTIPDGDDEEAGEDPENTDIDFYEDKSEFGNIDRIDYSDYQSVAFTQQMFCAYDSNAISEQTTFDFSNGTSCLTSQVKAGSLYLSKNITNHSEIAAKNNLYINGSVTLHNTGALESGDDTLIEGDTVLTGNSSIHTGKNLLINNHLTMHNNSTISTNGSAYIAGEISMTSQLNKIEVGHYVFISENVTLQNGAAINVTENAHFESNLKLNGSSRVDIGGNFIIDGALLMQGNTKLIIQGDARFKEVKTNWSDAIICVQGELLSGPTNAAHTSEGSTYQIKEQNYCGNEAGTIYVLKGLSQNP